MTFAHKIRHRLAATFRIEHVLFREAMGEFFGTFILVLLGDGVMAQTKLGDHGRFVHGSFIVVSLGWGLAVMMGVFFSCHTGKGLINPAVTAAFCLIGRVTLIQTVVFVLAQILGAFVGAAGVYSVYREHILMEEHPFAINTTSGIFCTWPSVSNAAAFWDQIVGTALLTGGALAIIDGNNAGVPGWAHAPFIALLVVSIVGSFALNAGAALNPARDLGPRIFISIAGWGAEAFTAHNFFFWVPILGPLIGAVFGALIYKLLVGIQVSPEMKDEAEAVGDGDIRKKSSLKDVELETQVLTTKERTDAHTNTEDA